MNNISNPIGIAIGAFISLFCIFGIMYCVSGDDVGLSPLDSKQHESDSEFLDRLYPCLPTEKIIAIVAKQEILETDMNNINILVEEYNQNKSGYEKSFDVQDGISAWNKIYTDALQEVSSRTDIVMVDRSKIDEIMLEHNFQVSDWSDESKTVEIGAALNANTIIHIHPYFDELTSEGFSNMVSIECININTMQKSVFSGHVDDFKNFEINIGFNEYVYKTLPKKIYFDHVKQSLIDYEREDLNKISPFSPVKITEKTKKVKTEHLDFMEVSEIEFMQDSDQFTYVLNNIKENGTYRFVPSDGIVNLFFIDEDLILFPDIIKVRKGEHESRWDGSITASYEGKFNTYKMGELILYNESKRVLFKGFIYNKDYEYAFHLGSEKDDGTDRQYFSFFTGE